MIVGTINLCPYDSCLIMPLLDALMAMNDVEQSHNADYNTGYRNCIHDIAVRLNELREDHKNVSWEK